MNTCAACGTNNVDGTRFCVQCGAALAPTPGAWRTPTEELRTPATASPPIGGPYAPPTIYGQTAVAPTAYVPTLPYAEWGDRAFAALIDGAITFGILILLTFICVALGAVGAGIGGSDSAAPIVIFLFGIFISALSIFGFGLYNKIYLVSKRGASIGQNIQHLKVVDATGRIPPVGPLSLRLLVQVGLFMVPGVNGLLVLLDLLFPLWDEKKQTIHDKAASTYVIKKV